jgi:hypothetical protein
MKTGVTYMGHHNPRHTAADFAAMRVLDLDDVLLAAQENDFRYFTGKIRFTPELARGHGLRPIAVFWGALNLFGGGRSSQFLLEHPECFQRDRDGNHLPAGCYVNPVSVAHICMLIDSITDAGYAGYFVDEPTPLTDCFCAACRDTYAAAFDGDLRHATPDDQARFRRRCVVDYVAAISAYCKQRHPQLETMCCVMPVDRAVWADVAALPHLDNIGTDLYWINDDRDVTEMEPLIAELAGYARQHGKRHHEWLQCWNVRAGREARIIDQGDILIKTQPDALYIWAWEGQIGVSESCDDPARAWAAACEVLRRAKQTG